MRFFFFYEHGEREMESVASNMLVCWKWRVT